MKKILIIFALLGYNSIVFSQQSSINFIDYSINSSSTESILNNNNSKLIECSADLIHQDSEGNIILGFDYVNKNPEYDYESNYSEFSKLVIRKYDPCYNLLWEKIILNGGINDEYYLTDIFIDEFDNIYYSGNHINKSVCISCVTSVIGKISKSGNLLWNHFASNFLYNNVSERSVGVVANTEKAYLVGNATQNGGEIFLLEFDVNGNFIDNLYFDRLYASIDPAISGKDYTHESYINSVFATDIAISNTSLSISGYSVSKDFFDIESGYMNSDYTGAVGIVMHLNTKAIYAFNEIQVNVQNEYNKTEIKNNHIIFGGNKVYRINKPVKTIYTSISDAIPYIIEKNHSHVGTILYELAIFNDDVYSIGKDITTLTTNTFINHFNINSATIPQKILLDNDITIDDDFNVPIGISIDESNNKLYGYFNHYYRISLGNAQKTLSIVNLDLQNINNNYTIPIILNDNIEYYDNLYYKHSLYNNAHFLSGINITTSNHSTLIFTPDINYEFCIAGGVNNNEIPNLNESHNKLDEVNNKISNKKYILKNIQNEIIIESKEYNDIINSYLSINKNELYILITIDGNTINQQKIVVE